MTIVDGWLDNVRRRSSPHCDDRPDPTDISLLVIHNISLPARVFGGPWIENLFLGKLDPNDHPSFQDIAEMRVSAHLLIRRDGSLIQFVPFQRRAWHAGESRYEDRGACNDFSIGIELEGADDVPYTDIQYQHLAQVSREIMSTYPEITRDRITGHSDIAPERKSDPGPAFDWQRFQQDL